MSELRGKFSDKNLGEEPALEF